MTPLYSRSNCQWKSLGSEKGNLLLQYATKTVRLLEEGRSVIFAYNEPTCLKTCTGNLSLSFLSGGTSKHSELVTHTIKTIRAAVSGLVDRIGASPINSVCCLPLHHVAGWMQLERAWLTGGEVIFCDYKDLKNEKNLNSLAGRWISLVPTQLHELLKFETAVSCLKKAKGIFVGGAGMSECLTQKTRSLRLHIYPCYGSSETAGMITLLNSSSFLNQVDGVGEVLSHASIRINNVSKNVQIRCASLCLSKGKKVFQSNAWLDTPDQGFIDSNGSLVLTGRSDQVINSGGYKIEPKVVERALYGTGIIEHCMVFGEQDEKWGEKVVACICPKDVNLSKLKLGIESLLPKYMQPREWRAMDELPLSEMGKPRKGKLGI